MDAPLNTNSGKLAHSHYMSGILFALAVLKNHGEEMAAGDIVSEVGGLKEVRRGICAEQDVETFKWLKGFCK